MSLILAALAAIQPAPAPSVPAEPIVVTANRLDRARFNLSLNRLTGKTRCTIVQSSGVAAIDAYMCDSGRYCARTSRKTVAAIKQCIADRKKAYLAQFGERVRS